MSKRTTQDFGPLTVIRDGEKISVVGEIIWISRGPDGFISLFSIPNFPILRRNAKVISVSATYPLGAVVVEFSDGKLYVSEFEAAFYANTDELMELDPLVDEDLLNPVRLTIDDFVYIVQLQPPGTINTYTLSEPFKPTSEEFFAIQEMVGDPRTFMCAQPGFKRVTVVRPEITP